MSQVPTSSEPQTPTGALPARPDFGHPPSAAMTMSRKWDALLEAAGVVAVLAEVPAAAPDDETREFPSVMRDAGGWREAIAEQGIEDLTAIMEPGLKALLAVHARGTHPAAAAQALWQEFEAARGALLSLAPPSLTERRLA